MDTESDNQMFFRQLLIFTAIIISAVAISYVANLYRQDLKKIGLKAAAAATENGKAIKALMTEDLDPE